MQPHFNSRCFLLCAFVAGFVSGCATAPVKVRQLNLVSEETVDAIGATDFANLKNSKPLSINADETSYVTCIVDGLTSAQSPPIKWEVAVFESDEPNAFAFPGGKIGVNSGLFNVAVTADQLAFVLGHEIGHVVAQHGHERMSQQMVVDTLDGISQIPSLWTAGIASTIGQLGILYPISQSNELEADAIGLDLAARAGFDPTEAIQFWKNMETFGATMPTAFLSSHASSERRIENLRDNMPASIQFASRVKERPNCDPPNAAIRLSVTEPISLEQAKPTPTVIQPEGDLVTVRSGIQALKVGHSAWGTALGSLVGLGVGHGIQGHYLKDGWKWTLIDIGFIGIASATQECTAHTTTERTAAAIEIRTQRDCVHTPQSTLAMIAWVGSHIWQGVELWRHTKSQLAMEKIHSSPGITFQQPTLVATDQKLQVGALWSW